jgi:DNA-binding response OmpR family regulator
MSHILIVEDELQLRRILTMNLARRGCSVGEADSVESGFDMVTAAWEAGYPFDLIILEIHLAQGCGWDLLRLLRTSEMAGEGAPLPPVITLSALPVARSRISEFAPVASLLKPFPIPALMRLIERYVGSAASAPARGA